MNCKIIKILNNLIYKILNILINNKYEILYEFAKLKFNNFIYNQINFI